MGRLRAYRPDRNPLIRPAGVVNSLGGSLGPPPAAPGNPVEVPTAPVRTQITVGTLPSSAGQIVFLRTDTATGTHVVFLAPPDALAAAAQLRYHGKAARSGLVLPPSGLGDPDTNGHDE